MEYTGGKGRDGEVPTESHSLDPRVRCRSGSRNFGW